MYVPRRELRYQTHEITNPHQPLINVNFELPGIDNHIENVIHSSFVHPTRRSTSSKDAIKDRRSISFVRMNGYNVDANQDGRNDAFNALSQISPAMLSALLLPN